MAVKVVYKGQKHRFRNFAVHQDRDFSGFNFVLGPTDKGYSRGTRGLALGYGIAFESCDFSGANLNGMDLPRGKPHSGRSFVFESCNFTEADLSETTIGRISRCIFKRTNLQNAKVSSTSMKVIGCDFSEASTDGATFWGTFESCSFEDLNLSTVNLDLAHLVGCNLKATRYDDKGLKNFPSRTFAGFESLQGCDLTGAQLAGQCLIKWSSFSTVQFSMHGFDPRTRAPAMGCNFRHADLRGADLRWVDFSRSNFRGCNLRGADLCFASLSGTDLRSVDLSGTIVYKTDFSDAIVDSRTVLPKSSLVDTPPQWVIDAELGRKRKREESLTRASRLPKRTSTKRSKTRKTDSLQKSLGPPAKPEKIKIPKGLRYEVFERDNHTCLSCGRSRRKYRQLELHVDHVVPESKGGPTHIDNLQTLCKDCNLGKGNRYHTDLRPGRGSARESDGGKRRGPRGTEAASPTSLEPLFPDDPPKI